MKKLVLLVCVLACTAAAGLLHHSGRLDRTPPRIELQVPDGPLSGDVAVEINVADLTPGLSEVRLSVDDGPPQRLDIDPSGHTTWTWPGGPGRPPGPHTLRVQATDSAWKPNTAELSIQRTTDDQPPELRFKLVPDRPAQGTVAALFVLLADRPRALVLGWAALPIAMMTHGMATAYGPGLLFVAALVWRRGHRRVALASLAVGALGGPLAHAAPVDPSWIEARPLPDDDLRQALTREYLAAHLPAGHAHAPQSVDMTPRAIVLHWTGTGSAKGAWHTFAPATLGGRPELRGVVQAQ